MGELITFRHVQKMVWLKTIRIRGLPIPEKIRLKIGSQNGLRKTGA